ncbi:MAG TPA: GAF domain-containing protein [Chloroflexota bacterium]|nr:GAF domain-containing protein [Chloroflexota bacterium]
MNETAPASGAAISRVRDAFGDYAQLAQIGAEIAAQDMPLARALAALPADERTPRAAAALATGYTEAQAARAARDTDTMRSALERQQAELAALHHVNAVATSSLDEVTVLNKVVKAVAQVMHVDVCSIYLLPAAGHLVLRATYGLNPLAVDKASLAMGEGVTGWAAQQGRTVAVSDLWCDARAKYLPETAEEDYHSLLSVPIRVAIGDHVLGVINVQTRECREFKQDEISFLEMIAGALGLSIENARLYGQTDAQLRQKINALTMLHQVVVAVSSSLDLHRVLNTIASQALSLSQGENSAIFARKGQQLREEAHCCEGDLQDRDAVQQTALAAIQQHTHQVNQLPGEADQPPRVVLCVPFHGHGSTYGALAITSKPGQQFDDETIDLLTDFAAEAALAIENARLHQATQQSLEAKSVLLSELHHRVKNNLQTVASLLSLALRHCKSEEAANTLRESYNRVRSIAAAHDLLSRESIGVTTIGDVARKVIELLEPTVQGRTAIRFLNEGETIDLETREATTLAILLNELITNAARHGLKGRESGTVRVTYGRQGSQVWVTVADDGNGLPEGFTLSKNRGLGLSIVRTLVEADLHGQVDCTGENGARFTLLFSPPTPASAQRADRAQAAG